MSIELSQDGVGRRSRDGGLAARLGPVLLVGLALLVGCGEGGAAEDTGASSLAEVAAAPAATDGGQARPATVADLFPEAEEKQMVLSNCATCHAVACAAIGRRSAARWDALANGHQEHVPALSDADRQRIFAYLAANFNDTRPEPDVPAEFLDRGCTPF